MFTTACPLSLSQARWIQSMPSPQSYFCKIHFNVIPSILRYSKWSLQVSAPMAYVYFSSYSYVLHAHLIHPYVITWIIFREGDESWSSSLCSFLMPAVTFLLLGPNIFLSILFLNTLILSFSLNIRDQVSHPYKTIEKITISYILAS